MGTGERKSKKAVFRPARIVDKRWKDFMIKQPGYKSRLFARIFGNDSNDRAGQSGLAAKFWEMFAKIFNVRFQIFPRSTLSCQSKSHSRGCGERQWQWSRPSQQPAFLDAILDQSAIAQNGAA